MKHLIMIQLKFRNTTILKSFMVKIKGICLCDIKCCGHPTARN